jgi:uncharacterized protein HemX
MKGTSMRLTLDAALGALFAVVIALGVVVGAVAFHHGQIAELSHENLQQHRRITQLEAEIGNHNHEEPR